MSRYKERPRLGDWPVLSTFHLPPYDALRTKLREEHGTTGEIDTVVDELTSQAAIIRGDGGEPAVANHPYLAGARRPV